MYPFSCHRISFFFFFFFLFVLYVNAIGNVYVNLFFLGADNFQMFVDKNLEAKQPFRLYRYGKNRRFISLFNVSPRFFNVLLKAFPQKCFWNKPSWVCNQLVCDSNRIQTYNHLLITFLYDAFNCMLLSCHIRVSEWNFTL